MCREILWVLWSSGLGEIRIVVGIEWKSLLCGGVCRGGKCLVGGGIGWL